MGRRAAWRRPTSDIERKEASGFSFLSFFLVFITEVICKRCLDLESIVQWRRCRRRSRKCSRVLWGSREPDKINFFCPRVGEIRKYVINITHLSLSRRTCAESVLVLVKYKLVSVWIRQFRHFADRSPVTPLFFIFLKKGKTFRQVERKRRPQWE